MATSRSVFAQFNAADGRLPDPAFQSATSTGTPTALPEVQDMRVVEPPGYSDYVTALTNSVNQTDIGQNYQTSLAELEAFKRANPSPGSYSGFWADPQLKSQYDQIFGRYQAATSPYFDALQQAQTSSPTTLPNFAQAFTADPTYENFKNLNQQQNTLTNAFGRGNTPFTLQDIQGVTSAFQQAIQPYAQQFQEQSGQEVLAQRMAAQQRMPFDPFMQQAPSIPLNQSRMNEMSGIDKEAASRASTQAFQDAVRAANPGLNFADRNPYRMSMDQDIYDQAESYYMQYGRGLPQFQQPATQTRALDPQNSNPNSAASQLSAFLAGVNNSPTGSMLGSAGTLPVPPAVQPSLQNTPQMLGGLGQMPNLSQMLGGPQPSVPTAPTAPTAPTSFGGSAFGQAGGAFPSTPGNYGGGASGGMALEGRYGIASGNSTPFPIQGNVSVVKLAQGGDVSKARQMLQRFADGGDVSAGLKYATGEGGIGADKYYENIRNFFANTPDEAATRAAMAEYGVSEADIKRATGRPLAEMFAPARQGLDAGALASELGIPTFQVANLLNQGLDASAIRNRYAIPVSVATDLMQRSMTGGVDTSEFDRLGGYERVKEVYDAAGGSYTPPFGQKPVTQPPAILPPTQPLPPLTEEFVAPTAPLPQAPPSALTPGQEGLDPGTAIVGAIPESERVKIPQLDTEFRASAPRTAIYDRFGRITGYNYSPAAKLTPATGTNVFNFVPPGITSRPRSLLNLGDVPGVTIDPVTGQPTLGLSASQRFARDRAELDNQFRQLYARAAAADTSLPTQAPSTAAAAFRQFAMNDPTMSAQLRFRNIEQEKYDPTKADAALRGQYGATPYAAALTEAFDPFLARNRASLLASKDMQRSYFERYPDLVAEYEKNWSKTMSPEEYAAYHYRTLGQKEGRTPPNLMGSPYTQQFFSKGGEASTEAFIKKQSGGDVSRGTSEVPQVDAEGRLIDEREEIRSESQRMLNRLQSQPSKLPPGLRRTVAATKEQGKESMFPAAAPARDLLSGILGASPTAPGSEAYRTGQAIANMPPVQAAAAIPAKIAASAGDAATALAAMGPAMAGAVRPYGKGTVFSGVKLANDRYVGSSLDDYIDQGKSAAFRTSDVVKADAIQKFFDTKARRYMSTQLGTERDPVFDAIKKGRISNLALHDIQGLRKYAIEAAGEGKYKVDKETGKNVLDQYGRPIFYPKDPQAVMDVTKAYDEMVDVKPMSFKPGLIPQTYKTSDPAYMQEAERIREQMLQAFEAEGLDPRLVNLKSDPMILTSTRDTGEPYYPGYLYRMDDFIKDKLSGNPEAMKGVPENIRRALDQDELLYDVGLKRGPLEDILDPESMANYLATLSPKEIDKIRFEDAVVGSAKFNRERIDRKFEGLRLQELVKSGKAPDKVFSKGVSEPLLQFGEDQRHPGFAWKRIEDLEATIPEGAYVGHSVGGYALGGTGYGPSFTKGFQEGTHEIYSLRDARNRPVTTIQVIDYGDKSNPYRVVKQIKGNGAKTGNTAPVDYDVEVYDFLTQVVKPDAITESDSYLTPMLIQYRDALEANRQTR